jgi:hypothetical protein
VNDLILIYLIIHTFVIVLKSSTYINYNYNSNKNNNLNINGILSSVYVDRYNIYIYIYILFIINYQFNYIINDYILLSNAEMT